MTKKFFMAGAVAGWESGNGPALLFLHGGPGVNEYSGLFAPEAGGWRFITFQQRGVTPSTTDGPYTVEQNVADAVAVLDARGVDRAVVVGHSWGGHLALAQGRQAGHLDRRGPAAVPLDRHERLVDAK